MRARRWWWRIITAPAAVLQLLLDAVAWMLSPWRIGRMLRNVSVPRMHENALRTNLTILGVALGVAVLVAVLLVGRSIERGVAATMDEIAGKADLQVQGGSSGFDEALIDKVRAIPGVYKVTPMMRQIVTARGAGGRRERVLLLGVDLLGTDDGYFRSYRSPALPAIRRDPLIFMNEATNVILSGAVAKRLGVKAQDEIEIATGHGPERFRVWGLLEDEGVGAAFSGAVGIMYYPALQVTFDRGRNIDSLDVAVRPGTDAQPVARALRAALGPGFRITASAMRGQRVGKMLLTIKAGLGMSSLVALMAGALLVFNTVTISISQRKRELGTLRALGTTRGQLIRLLTFEGLLLGSVGAVVGIALGVYGSRALLRLTTRTLDELLLQVAVNEVHLDLPMVAAGVALGIGFATIAARLAAQRAAAIQPAEALRSRVDSERGPRRSRVSGELVGLALIVSAFVLLQLPAVGSMRPGAQAAGISVTLAVAFFMSSLVRAVHVLLSGAGRRWLGVEATLAADNLRRELSRTAGAASGLMLAVALSIGSATFTSTFIDTLLTWADQTLPGQLFVTSGTSITKMSGKNTLMSETVRDELLALPGVAAVRPVRFLESDFRGEPIKILCTDFGVFSATGRIMLLEGEHEEVIEQVKRGATAVSENFSRRFGVHKGSTIALGTKGGTRSFEVAGVVKDYSSDIGTVWLERANSIELFGDRRVDTYELHLRPGVDPEVVRQAINTQLSERLDLFVLTHGDYLKELKAEVNGLLPLMKVLELVTLLVAALGVLTAVLANVLDRVREIGMLRAVGMLRAQVRKIITLEATLTGAIGLLGGVIAGAALGYITVKYTMATQLGWDLPYQLPWRNVATVALVTLPVSALAGLLPARAASGLIVSRALEYE